MFGIIVIVIIIAAFLLMAVVLIQAPKGGGLGAGFGGGGGANMMGGVQRTSDLLERATWGLMAFILVASVVSVMFIESGNQGYQVDSSEGTELMKQIQDRPE